MSASITNGETTRHDIPHDGSIQMLPMKYSCYKIETTFPDLTTNLEEIYGTEGHVKWHQENSAGKIWTMGVSIGKMT